MSKKMVEATVKKRGGRVAVRMMNTTQALDMPETEGIEFSHPDEKPGETEVRLTDRTCRGRETLNTPVRPF
jgi:hypothetical protein